MVGELREERVPAERAEGGSGAERERGEAVPRCRAREGAQLCNALFSNSVAHVALGPRPVAMPDVAEKLRFCCGVAQFILAPIPSRIPFRSIRLNEDHLGCGRERNGMRSISGPAAIPLCGNSF
jgi:hypothetical protein